MSSCDIGGSGTMSVMDFDWAQAFSRNIGWVTEAEQHALRSKRIAIAGLGGVGGSHLLTLTRLGIGSFTIADFDSFEIHNINRQAGAFASTLGQLKVDVLSRMASDINPALNLRAFVQGVSQENLDAFLQDVDLYVDALDYFAMETRRRVFAACRRRGIPALTAAPLGMSTALLIFMPDSMSFDEYFDLGEQSPEEQALRFLVGLSPSMLQASYLVDRSSVDFSSGRGPSTAMACELCAGVAGTEALKILLRRTGIQSAPHGMHFDAYRRRLSKTWRPGGNRNPLQRLILSIARRQLLRA